jgi:hypothetical protein
MYGIHTRVVQNPRSRFSVSTRMESRFPEPRLPHRIYQSQKYDTKAIENVCFYKLEDSHGLATKNPSAIDYKAPSRDE